MNLILILILLGLKKRSCQANLTFPYKELLSSAVELKDGSTKKIPQNCLHQPIGYGRLA